MPKRVIVTTVWSCSLCQGETEEDKITAYQLYGGGAKLALDVCATCAASDPWATVLAAGISERAASTAKRRPVEQDPAGDLACRYCGNGFGSARGLSQHLSKAHGVKSATERMSADRGKEGNLSCPECGFRSPHGAGLASHRRTAHGVQGEKGSGTTQITPPVEAPVRRRRKP